MKVVDLQFKTVVEKFIQNNELSMDFEAVIFNMTQSAMFQPKMSKESIKSLLQDEDTGPLLHCIVVAAKLLAAMKVKSNKLDVRASAQLTRIMRTDLVSFDITFTFKHLSTAKLEYLVFEVIYPRINTILLALHKKYNVTFGITSYPAVSLSPHGEVLVDEGNEQNDYNSPPPGPSPLTCLEAASSCDVSTQEVFNDHSVTISYIVFPQCENPAMPLACIYIKDFDYIYSNQNLVATVLLNSLSNYTIMDT